MEEVQKREAICYMLFTHDAVLIGDASFEVDKRQELWRDAIENRGMKSNRQKTEYLCMGKKEPERK